MRKISFVALVFAALISAVHAQEKLLTVDDIFSPDPAVRVPFGGTTVRITWTADGRSFRQMQNGRLVRVDAETGEATPFYDDKRFAATLVEVAKMTEADANRTANSVALQFDKGETAILLNHTKDLWHYTVATGILKRLTDNPDE